MSMKEYAVDTYGILLDKALMKQLASKICEDYSDDDTHEEEFEIVLDYDDFQVFLHHESGCYFYLEKSDGEFYELELCATLQYDVCHELLLDPAETGEVMSALFDCDCCGEYVTDDYIEYLWFKRVE